MKTASALSSAAYLLRGLRLLNRPGIRGYVALPLGINLVVYLLVGWFVGRKILAFNALLLGHLPPWLGWLDTLVWLLFGLIALLVTAYTFTLLANLIAAPFNGLLAERVELAFTGSLPPDNGDWKVLMKNIIPDLANELRKVLYFASRAGVLFLLTLIPVVNLFAAPLWLIFSAWMMALEYLDYPMANHRLRFKAQRLQHRQYPVNLLSFGAATLLISVTPVINLLAMPAAVAGATALWVEQLQPARGESAPRHSERTARAE